MLMTLSFLLISSFKNKFSFSNFFMQGVGIALLSNFFTFRFFISLIQRLSFFSIIRIFICMGVLSQVLLFNWLILSFLWFLSFSFSPVITVRWLLLAVDVAILFIVYWSVWVLTSVFLDVISECSGILFEKLSNKMLMTLSSLLISSFKNKFSFSNWFRNLSYFSSHSFFSTVFPKLCSILDSFLRKASLAFWSSFMHFTC